MKRYCFALDLKNDPALIDQYKEYHRAVWPEILQSIQEPGITVMDIYCTGNRLFMIMEVNEGFSFDDKNLSDAGNRKVQEWEKLMWEYQQALPFSKPGEKWVMMEKIFSL